MQAGVSRWVATLVLICIAIALGPTTVRAAPTYDADERMIPVSIGGDRVRLAVRIFAPHGDGPFPTLIFHHGSTGRGTDPKWFAASWQPDFVIRFFLDRGWSVVVPSRRGRGKSEGLYDEGFGPNRKKGYSFKPKYSLAGADRALADIDAVTERILELPFVDTERVIVGGQSRGGILSVAHAGMRPDLYRGVINFVGGWLGGKRRNTKQINRDIFERGVPFGKETLWIYAKDDFYYSLRTTRSYFADFEKAGGKGVFFDDFPRKIGHSARTVPEHWGPTVDAYLSRMGLPNEPTPSALRYTPNSSLAPDAFHGTWKGYWRGSSALATTLEISTVSADGTFAGTYTSLTNSRAVDGMIKDGILTFTGSRKSVFEFFAGSDNALVGTYRRPKTSNRPRRFYRVILTRVTE